MSVSPKEFFKDRQVVQLCRAAASGSKDKLQSMIDEGADLNHAGKDGVYPALWALLDDQYQGFVLLLEQGASPNQLTDTRESVMSIAAQHPDVAYLKAAVAHGGDLALRDRYEATPLITATKKNRSQNMVFLLDEGSDVSLQDQAGWSALMHAVSLNKLELVKPLLDAGADPKQKALSGMAAVDIAKMSAGSDVKALFGL